MTGALLAAWLLHEFGHWLALRLLGFSPALQGRWLLGLALELPPACQGWRESAAALAGPCANLLALALDAACGWEEAFAANFVMAAVNLLPFLPLDGGKLLRGLLSGRWSWLGVSRFLLFWGKGAALAVPGLVYWFGLSRWLLLAALWLYLLAAREERSLPYLLTARLYACRGQSLRPRRLLRPQGKALSDPKLLRRFSPGWRNLVCWEGECVEGDRLVEDWLKIS